MSDTTPRDRLAQIIEDHRYGADIVSVRTGVTRVHSSSDLIAAAVIAAGWRPPARTVATVEELDALAVGSVVVDGDHTTPDDTGMGFSEMPGVFHRFSDGRYVVAGHGPRDVPLPATVLWEQEEGAVE